MASIWDYKVSFPYGATSAPYSPISPHKGEDRAAPMGVAITVNGNIIGYVGTTGYSTGTHLHVGKWKGSNHYPPNGGGATFTNAVVTQVAEDTVNGKYVRIQADGYSWVYLHMSRQTATVGQVLKQVTSTKGDNVFQNDKEVQEAYLLLRGNPGTAAERKGWIGQPKQRFFQVGKAEADSVRKQLADVKKALANEQAKPPKEIVRTIEKVIEKPVGEEEAVRGFFGKLLDLVFKKG